MSYNIIFNYIALNIKKLFFFEIKNLFIVINFIYAYKKTYYISYK